MSKIYDALVQAAKKPDLTAATFRDRTAQKSRLLNFTSENIGLQWKVLGTVAAVMLALGLVLVITASQTMGRALRKEIDQRALAMATNFANGAAAPVIGKNILDLYALITKYAQLQGVAYAFVEDGNGKVVGHSVRPFPTELTDNLTSDERRQVGTRVVTLQGKTVYESRVPILEGQLGTAHLGLWADGVKTEINAARLPFIGFSVLVLFVAVALSVFLVRIIIAPATELRTDVTDKEDPGELSASVKNRFAR